MDPATTFQVACGVIQLIEAGVKAIKTFQEIYNNESSLSAENQELFDQAFRLQQSTTSVTARLASLAGDQAQLTDDQKRLQQVAKECGDLDHELLQKLESLKISGQKRKRDVPATWLKAHWKKDDISRIRNRLQSCQKQLDTEMLTDIW